MTRIDLCALLRRTRVVLLDFDGPVCDVFSAYPAPRVAADLCDHLDTHAIPVPSELRNLDDPLALLRRLHRRAPEHHPTAEAFLAGAEIRAASCATPTPGAVEVLTACARQARPVAVVSNNSPEAIRAFLTKHGLEKLVTGVFGRDKTTPDRLKPDPHLLVLAATALDTPHRECLMVGDSTTDIQAAHALDMSALGYANQPGKQAAFEELGCQAVITHMTDLAHALQN
ncbi:HAD family hydrolase [Thermobifida halotolerans]|uniref:HAD family hydrolase n=1 Tax=Thermobifida halotolerans TaxID=483545 RepID=A0A399FYM8_9ACTN|nr:HAD family hydrolase [Thermobifida halotolerans]UOE19439.1 HAD family hydrolase [Thermobifida halotolerans]